MRKTGSSKARSFVLGEPACGSGPGSADDDCGAVIMRRVSHLDAERSFAGDEPAVAPFGRGEHLRTSVVVMHRRKSGEGFALSSACPEDKHEAVAERCAAHEVFPGFDTVPMIANRCPFRQPVVTSKTMMTCRSALTVVNSTT